MVILARNWRGAGGELDLAALDGEMLVFVEVKMRQDGFEADRPAVTGAQRRRIARAARAFRGRYGVRELPFRFDLVTVAGDPRRDATVVWFKDYHRIQEQA